jgi:hypothetical protein
MLNVPLRQGAAMSTATNPAPLTVAGAHNHHQGAEVARLVVQALGV